MQQDIVVYGVAIVVILIAIVSFAVYTKKNKGKDEAMQFLYDLSEQMVKISLEIIASFDPSKYDNIAEFESACLSKIYTDLWEFVSKTADEKLEDGSLIKLAMQYINSDTLIKVIDEIFTKEGIFDKVEARFGEYKIANDDSVEQEKALIEEFSNEEEYFEEKEVDKESDLEAAEEKEPSEEELAALNPPREDEEEEFNPEDDSMELVEEPGETFPKIIVSKDKNDNTLYYEVYSDGKKKRVKKEYALKHMS